MDEHTNQTPENDSGLFSQAPQPEGQGEQPGQQNSQEQPQFKQYLSQEEAQYQQSPQQEQQNPYQQAPRQEQLDSGQQIPRQEQQDSYQQAPPQGQYRQNQNQYQQPGWQDPQQQGQYGQPYQPYPYQQNQYQQPYQQNQYQQAPPRQSNGMALASMIVGIFALLTCCIPFIQFPLAVISIVLVILSKKGKPFHGFAIAGLVMAIISILVSIGMTFYWGYVIKMMNDPEFMEMYNELMEMYQ